MSPDCPNYKAPRRWNDIEGTAMCDLIDKPCIVEYSGERCETYEDYLRELKEDSNESE